MFGKLLKKSFIIFFVCLLCSEAAFAGAFEARQVSDDKVPWAFWAVLDRYGGIGYSYSSKKALTRSMGYWHYSKGTSGYDLAKGASSELIGDNDALKEYYKNLPQAKLVDLSPIEKLALVSNQDFVELEMLVKDDIVLFADDWWGNCNGVAYAALTIAEPSLKVGVRDPWGREVVFSPADIKALAALYYAFGDFVKIGEVGTRSVLKPHELDTITRERISMNRPFYVDISPGEERWNEPVFAYEREVLAETKNHQGLLRQEVRLTLHVAFVKSSTVLAQPQIQTQQLVAGRNPQYSKSVDVRYILEIDPKTGQVVKSEWDSRFPQSRIDYVVYTSGRIENTEGLKEMLPSFPIVEHLMGASVK